MQLLAPRTRKLSHQADNRQHDNSLHSLPCRAEQEDTSQSLYRQHKLGTHARSVIGWRMRLKDYAKSRIEKNRKKLQGEDRMPGR